MDDDFKKYHGYLSSPSGAVGKTTITKKIQQKYKSFKISVSHKENQDLTKLMA